MQHGRRKRAMAGGQLITGASTNLRAIPLLPFRPNLPTTSRLVTVASAFDDPITIDEVTGERRG